MSSVSPYNTPLYQSPFYPLATTAQLAAQHAPWADHVANSLIDPSLQSLPSVGTNYTLSPSIYHPSLHIAMAYHLQEHLHVAKLELAKVTREHDMLRTVLSKLAEKLSVSSGKIIDFTPLELPYSALQSQPTCETHPSSHFWKRTDYIDWKGTAAAVQRGNLKPHGKLLYLEDADGSSLDDATMKSIRKLLCVGLNDLLSRGIAPKKWGQATPGAVAHLRRLLEHAYPLFTFAEHRWKLDHFIITYYPF
ncbi:hypothetical protein JVU11DRAFT_437 [Chiua virens]|nr:hypothetical protein JVU11DRAFT_437 [Chiua virens]